MKNKEFYIGTSFIPFDNSYVKNITTGEENITIVPEIDYTEHYRADDKGPYICVSEPYKECIEFNRKTYLKSFINVESKSTGNIYRTLFEYIDVCFDDIDKL